MAHEATTDELADYRPVSPLAVATLVCGVAAALVLVTPLAAMLPLFAVVLAVAAFADLRRAEGKRAGRPLVLAGLALALGFAGQALAGAVLDGWIARQRALAAATAWIAAVREERFADAMAMCGPQAYPLPHEVTVGTEPPAPGVREEAFRATAAVRAIEACGQSQPAVTQARRLGTGGSVWRVSGDLKACGIAPGELRVELESRAETGPRGPLERWLVVGLGVER